MRGRNDGRARENIEVRGADGLRGTRGRELDKDDTRNVGQWLLGDLGVSGDYCNLERSMTTGNLCTNATTCTCQDMGFHHIHQTTPVNFGLFVR